jgi:hypothetical protein
MAALETQVVDDRCVQRRRRDAIAAREYEPHWCMRWKAINARLCKYEDDVSALRGEEGLSTASSRYIENDVGVASLC